MLVMYFTNKYVTSCETVLIHLNLIVNLIKQSTHGILTQIEFLTKFLNNHLRVVILEHLDLLDVATIEFNLEHTDRLFHRRKHRSV